MNRVFAENTLIIDFSYSFKWGIVIIDHSQLATGYSPEDFSSQTFLNLLISEHKEVLYDHFGKQKCRTKLKLCQFEVRKIQNVVARKNYP